MESSSVTAYCKWNEIKIIPHLHFPWDFCFLLYIFVSLFSIIFVLMFWPSIKTNTMMRRISLLILFRFFMSWNILYLSFLRRVGMIFEFIQSFVVNIHWWWLFINSKQWFISSSWEPKKWYCFQNLVEFLSHFNANLIDVCSVWKWLILNTSSNRGARSFS